MADDPALIWDDDRRPRRRPPPPSRTDRRAAAVPADTPLPGGRIPLAEAHRQFGVAPSTLAAWARAGKVDAVKEEGRWMVTAASVAARLSERHGGRRRGPRPGGTRRAGAPGPTADGTAMLVPRDAWDKLMDQLGNLHEAGQMLADARERAAKAETEVGFLRERLAEMRGERDLLRERVGDPGFAAPAGPGFWKRIGAAFRSTPPGGGSGAE
jgi:hypothetical protein